MVVGTAVVEVEVGTGVVVVGELEALEALLVFEELPWCNVRAGEAGRGVVAGGEVDVEGGEEEDVDVGGWGEVEVEVCGSLVVSSQDVCPANRNPVGHVT